MRSSFDRKTKQNEHDTNQAMKAIATERPTTDQRHAGLVELGFALVVESGPNPGLDKADTKDGHDWPHIAFDVSLHFKGKEVLHIPYKLGIGHVKPKSNRTAGRTISRFTADEESMLMAWQSRPTASFKDKALQAQVAAKLAVAQNVKPELCDVLHSLLSDGEAFLGAQSFEDWCGDFGYDADSRKAEATWKLCDNTGRKLANSIPKAALDKAREILADY